MTQSISRLSSVSAPWAVRRDAPDGPKLLRGLRVEAGLSQNQLAQRAHIDPAYVNRIERRLGSHAPSRAVVLRLCEALGLDLDRGDRLLFAFGLAGRVDWQAACQQLAADVPAATASAVEQALANSIRLAAEMAEPLHPEGGLPP